jgi:hypothetical protein
MPMRSTNSPRSAWRDQVFPVALGSRRVPERRRRRSRSRAAAPARPRLPLLVHAESPAALAHAESAYGAGDPRAHATWLALRSEEAEVEAVEMLVQRCREHRARIHVVHVSSAGAIARIAAARAEGLPLTAETCPHYLTFTAADVPDGATEFKCAPPIRARSHQTRCGARWSRRARSGRDRSFAVSARAQAAGERDFIAAWGGIAGLQLLLPLTWTGAAARGHEAATMLVWTAERPAALAGLAGRKGRIAAGHDADLVVWDDQDEFTVAPEMLFHRHPLTPYAGLRCVAWCTRPGCGAGRCSTEHRTRAGCDRRVRRGPSLTPFPKENAWLIPGRFAVARAHHRSVARCHRSFVLYATDEYFAARRTCSSRRHPNGVTARTPIAASGWTAGNRSAAARRGTTS